MQSPLEMEQVALVNMVIWTLQLCDQTSLVPYSTENCSNSDSTVLKRYQRKKKKTCTGLTVKHFISFVELCGKKYHIF